MKGRVVRIVGGALLLVVVAAANLSTASAVDGRPATGLPPAGSAAQAGWTSIPKRSSGLGASASFGALASNRDALLLAGSEPNAHGGARATIWRSPDGFFWTETMHPSTSGSVAAVAVDGDTALAVGGTSLGDVTSFVWRSDDGGRTWNVAAHGRRVFGVPAPAMGRPSVSGLIRYDGWWVASGGRSDGYAAIWVSRNGTRWRQVLGPNTAGAATVAEGRDGSLLAYWVTTAWFTRDPTRWGAPRPVSVPHPLYVSDVARRATLSVGANLERHGQPTPLLQSVDGGHTWNEDVSFLSTFADAHVETVARAGGVWVAAGASGAPDHVDAWISSDRRAWTALPPPLYGDSVAGLQLVAALDGRIVLFSTSPDFDRYYTIDRNAPGR
jgi:hypothetical protein